MCIPSWNFIPSPNVSGADNSLNAIAATAENDIWVSGSYRYPGELSQSLVQHWDGQQWSIVNVPEVGTVHQLFGVPSDDIWALGSATKPAPQFLLHWNGTTWEKVASDIHARSLGGSSEIDVWEVEYPDTLRHWNGTSWEHSKGTGSVPPPQPIWDIKAFDSTDIWAVGDYYISLGIIYPILIRWDGENWSYAAAPSPNLYAFTSIDGTHSNDVWIASVHTYGYNGSDLYHWNGSQWKKFRGPRSRQEINIYTGLAALANDDVWAVGAKTVDSEESQAVVGHWDGTRWSSISLPLLDGTNAILYDIAAVNYEDLWAVGSQMQDGLRQTLILHATRPCYLPPAPRLRLPKDKTSVSETNITLDWKGSPTATYFKLQVRPDNRTTKPIVRVRTEHSEYRAEDLLPNTKYLWRVRGCNGGGCGTWSRYRSFQVQPE